MHAVADALIGRPWCTIPWGSGGLAGVRNLDDMGQKDQLATRLRMNSVRQMPSMSNFFLVSAWQPKQHCRPGPLAPRAKDASKASAPPLGSPRQKMVLPEPDMRTAWRVCSARLQTSGNAQLASKSHSPARNSFRSRSSGDTLRRLGEVSGRASSEKGLEGGLFQIIHPGAVRGALAPQTQILSLAARGGQPYL